MVPTAKLFFIPAESWTLRKHVFLFDHPCIGKLDLCWRTYWRGRSLPSGCLGSITSVHIYAFHFSAAPAVLIKNRIKRSLLLIPSCMSSLTLAAVGSAPNKPLNVNYECHSSLHTAVKSSCTHISVMVGCGATSQLFSQTWRWFCFSIPGSWSRTHKVCFWRKSKSSYHACFIRSLSVVFDMYH